MCPWDGFCVYYERKRDKVIMYICNLNTFELVIPARFKTRKKRSGVPTI